MMGARRRSSRRSPYHEWMLDSMALADFLDQARHELDERCEGVILEAECEREVEEHL